MNSEHAGHPEYERWNEALGREIASRFASAKGGLLPALHEIQAKFGHVPHGAIAVLADSFNLSRAEVHGVVTFYHDFRAAPAGRHVLKLCRAEACQAVGAVAIAEAAKRALGLDWGETGADGKWTLEPVFCLGLCACGPAAMLDGELHARIDDAHLRAIIETMDE
jgi:formate dehydrogenase subunit gamma